MGIFDKAWNDEIAEVTGDRQWQQAEVEIYDPAEYDPDLYDPETDEYNGPDATVLYEGQARVITTRAAIQSNDAQPNKTSIRFTRVQLPQFAVGLVKRGSYIRFIQAPRNPALLRRIGTIFADLQGSSAATRTFEVNFDLDVVEG